MFVNGHGVLDGRIQELLVRVCGQCDGAIHLAWKLAAVDVFAGHGVIPHYVIRS